MLLGWINNRKKTQVDSMLLHMGAQLNKLLDTINVVDDDWNSYTKMKSLFENHYIKKANIIYKRSKFNTRAQKEGETAQEFIAAIIQLSKTCNYGTMTEELVRDRESNLTLNECKMKIMQHEKIKLENKSMRNGLNSREDVNRIKKPSKQYTMKRDPDKNKRKTDKQYLCGRCGNKRHDISTCSAIKPTCNKYEQVNGIGEITNKVQGGGSKPWTIKLNLNEEEILFKIDTGADESILSLNCYRKMKNPPKIKKTSLKLCGPTGLGRIKDVRHDITLIENAVPYIISSPRRIPIPLMEKVKVELDRIKHEGVIDEMNEPTE
ncbi:hypothetical protein QE152_g29873 [Popillia japonica]|uniref:Peptidase A2 domain-containing protein n=1 Tax=Popillia japonica TaxID=7064 RepID=A0AAW1JG66_POPJA